jgi:hypothetical protein
MHSQILPFEKMGQQSVLWKKELLSVNGKIALEDDPGSGRPPRSDFCESLQALIDEIPFISWRRMC